ncbi:MAG: cbb3-type cytochrome c oxidase subunit 3 [Gammaproteobacteria bacterium]|nr:cbb3-type cytochrome c oxidase subunit 3 [Gammaproteobacteria bacterium]
MMMLFVGIWIWVWLPRHQRSFGRLARLPMEDAGTQRHGPLPPIAGEQRR